MTEILDTLISDAHQYARSVMVGTKKELIPFWAMVGPDRKNVVAVAATPWCDNAEKEAMVAGVKQLMREHGATAYSFVCEAWVSTYKHVPGTPFKRPPGTPMPSQDPRRREMVTAMATDGVAHKFTMWSIRRDKRGRCTALPLEVEEPDAGMLSWLANLLGGTA
jgi:hypothetical protein